MDHLKWGVRENFRWSITDSREPVTQVSGWPSRRPTLCTHAMEYNVYSLFFNLVVNALRSEQVWPSNVKHCPQSWALGERISGKALSIWYTTSGSC